MFIKSSLIIRRAPLRTLTNNLSPRKINTAAIFQSLDPSTELKTTSQSISFEQDYHIRSSLEKIIHRYATKPYQKITLNKLVQYGGTNLSMKKSFLPPMRLY